MISYAKFEEFLGEAVERAMSDQERTIGSLPDGSTVLELPPWARWIVIHPTEAPKAITMDGRLVDLSSPSIRQESEAE